MKKKKQKIRKSIANRFKITKTGKVLHRGTFNRHLKRKKSHKQLKRLKKPMLIKETMAKKITKALEKKNKKK